MTNENTATTDVATAAYDAAPATADQAAHDAGPQPTTGTAPESRPEEPQANGPHDAGPQGPEPQASGILRTTGAHAPVLDEATPDITDEGTTTDLEARTFASYGVEPEICQALAAKGITHPFPIQALTLPVALDGKDIIGQAKTGTGKTLGFGIPLLMDTLGPGEEGWDADPAAGSPQALIILPTRELAKQVAEELSMAAARRTVRIVQV